MSDTRPGRSSYPASRISTTPSYIRRRILLAFELAETEPDAGGRAAAATEFRRGGRRPERRRNGGLYRGTRKSGACVGLPRHRPALRPHVLVEAAPRLLTTFDPSLSETARRSLGQLGVEVRLRTGVTKCGSSGISIGSEPIESRTIIWAAGVKATPAAQWLGPEHDRAGRVKVEPDLSVPGHPNIFVIGDAALMLGANGKPMPCDAGVAKQQGKYVAKLLMARSKSKMFPPSRYRDLGSIAANGRKSAIVQITG